MSKVGSLKKRRIWKRDYNICKYCKKFCEEDKTIDHIIPVSKGGTNYDSNLVTCCQKCNTKKGANLPF